MLQARGMFFVTKMNGVNQSPRFSYSHSMVAGGLDVMS